MDELESGGTLGRKKGKKTRKASAKKEAIDPPKPQSISHDEHQDLEEELDERSGSPAKSLHQALEQRVEVPLSDTGHSVPNIIAEPLSPVVNLESNSNNDINQKKIDLLEAQLAQALSENAQLDDKYKGLLGRVASIRTTLTDRLNKDAEELQQTKGMVESLEEQKREVIAEKDALEASLKQTLSEKKILSQEIQDLRHRFSVSQQNWSKEREEAEIIQNRLAEELENTRKKAQDWEVLALEESSVRRALEERSSDIEEQYISQKTLIEKEISIRSQQTSKISDLQRALNDIQQTRKEELRDIVESTQAQIESLISAKSHLEEKVMAAEAQSSRFSEEIKRMSHLESEVKEKTLLIGKLRHQGVILNEHLTKALRMIKRGDPQDNVDRQLVTNLFLSFLGLPRGDAKRYEVLQLIANYLKWTDEDRETAGLSRPGASGYPGSIPSRSMQSPLAQTHLIESRDTNNSGENLAELWASFLQQQTESKADAF